MKLISTLKFPFGSITLVDITGTTEMLKSLTELPAVIIQFTDQNSGQLLNVGATFDGAVDPTKYDRQQVTQVVCGDIAAAVTAYGQATTGEGKTGTTQANYWSRSLSPLAFRDLDGTPPPLSSSVLSADDVIRDLVYGGGCHPSNEVGVLNLKIRPSAAGTPSEVSLRMKLSAGWELSASEVDRPSHRSIWVKGTMTIFGVTYKVRVFESNYAYRGYSTAHAIEHLLTGATLVDSANDALALAFESTAAGKILSDHCSLVMFTEIVYPTR